MYKKNFESLFPKGITYHLFQELQNELFTILSKHTGQNFEQIAKDCNRDHWMKALQAKEYGLVDEVLSKTIRAEVAR